ncbi:MAG: hypothetical protein ABEL51_10465 [Salinibacter sp.]
MPSPSPRPRQTDISDARSPDDSFASVQLPLDSRPSDLKQAVEALRQCPSEELRRARTHHRRALKALREGAYDALSEETRERLIQRFQTNLTALNEALKPENEEAETPPRETSSSLFRKALTWIW